MIATPTPSRSPVGTVLTDAEMSALAAAARERITPQTRRTKDALLKLLDRIRNDERASRVVSP